MIKKLLDELFKKVENEKDNDKKTKNGNSIYFVEKILEEKFRKPNFISSKAIKGYYDKYVEGKENKAGEPSSELKNLMARYLGYDDFLDFENKTKLKVNFVEKRETENFKKGDKIKGFKKWFIIVGIIGVLFFILYSKGVFGNKEACFVWKENHYEKVSLNNEKQNPTLICGNNIEIEKFEKVKVSDTTTFFIKGRPIIWYGKSKKGEFEYFNSRGIHPITKKELKPITEYIIDKYIKITDSLKTTSNN